jgi:hypothetical protein
MRIYILENMINIYNLVHINGEVHKQWCNEIVYNAHFRM